MRIQIVKQKDKIVAVFLGDSFDAHRDFLHHQEVGDCTVHEMNVDDERFRYIEINSGYYKNTFWRK